MAPITSTRDRADRREGRRLWRPVALVALAGLALGLVVGCGDDDDQAGDDSDDDLAEVAESAGARAIAEAYRLVLFADDHPDADRRQVAILQESVDDLPGDPDITGITDDDGDGLDDDGKVEVRVNDEVACVSVATDGGVDVTGGAC
jgi:hypothetical protein